MLYTVIGSRPQAEPAAGAGLQRASAEKGDATMDLENRGRCRREESGEGTSTDVYAAARGRRGYPG